MKSTNKTMQYLQKRFTYHKTCRDYDERNSRTYKSLCNHNASVLALQSANKHQACMDEITTIASYLSGDTWQDTYCELSEEENDDNDIL